VAPTSWTKNLELLRKNRSIILQKTLLGAFHQSTQQWLGAVVTAIVPGSFYKELFTIN
jgi:hypothetical protein